MPTKYHRCGQAVWVYTRPQGKTWDHAFASLEAHKAITHCPKCGGVLNAGELTAAKPEPMQGAAYDER